ncbi:hypothetical protein P7D25_02865 [Lactococcus petauri]|nr:hypothetical protein [Lactococcus petauri]
MKISSFYSFLLSYSCPLLSYYRYSSLCFQNRSTRDKKKKRSILVWLGWAGLSWAGLGWAGLGWAGLGWAGLGWAGLGWKIIEHGFYLVKYFVTFKKQAQHL